MSRASPRRIPDEPQPIASVPHFVGLILVVAVGVALGVVAQHGQSDGQPAGQLADHHVAISAYLSGIALEWTLLGYCWLGVRRRGRSVWALAGGRWTSFRDVAVDLTLALPFWLLFEATDYGVSRLLPPSSARSVESLLPQSPGEVVAWMATCISAGICEEMVFRGYLLRQLHAFSKSLVVAIVAQAVLFGVSHAYQGWEQVTIICVLGALYGVMAAWRRNLRVNIVAHAWGDFWGGWLKFIVWR